jgi:8-oxo-dGTP diphosphatase
MSVQGVEPAGHRDAAFGLAHRAGRTLLVRNDRVSHGTLQPCWDLPGGAVRRGEELTQALCREWREETGLSATVGDLRLVLDGVKRRPAGPDLYTWRAFFFDVECTGTPAPGAGIDEAVWVRDEEVVARLTAPYHEPLRRHLGGDSARYRPGPPGVLGGPPGQPRSAYPRERGR